MFVFSNRFFWTYILSLLLFGSNGVVASHISLTSYEIVLLRSMIASLFLLALFTLKRGHWHVLQHRRDFLFLVLSGAATGANWLFLYEAYRHIGVSLSTLLCYCGPVIIMILSPILFRERLTVKKLFGFFVVVVGVILINGQVAADSRSLWGLFCGLMSAVMYAVLVTCTRQCVHITGLENVAVQMTASFVTVAIFVAAKGGLALQIPTGEMPWVLLLGLINTGVGCFLYLSSISRLPVQMVAICGYLEPLSAVVLSVLLLGEPMSPIRALGAVMVLGGAMFGALQSESK